MQIQDVNLECLLFLFHSHKQSNVVNILYAQNARNSMEFKKWLSFGTVLYI